MKRSTLNLAVILLLTVTSMTAVADVLNVPGDYFTIQEAIDGAQDFDTVLVEPGNYVENIEIVGKVLTVASLFLTTGDWNHIGSTVIDGNFNGSVVYFYDIEGEDQGALVGFTLQNGDAYNGGGVFCENASPQITHCHIRYNNGVSGGGVLVVECSPVIRYCTIYQNIANYGGGVLAVNSTVSISNCTIYGNTALLEEGGGVFGFESVIDIVNCILWENQPDQVCLAAEGDPSDLHIGNSDIMDGIDGVVTNDNGELLYDDDNINEYPGFLDPQGGDFTFDENSPCYGAGMGAFKPSPLSAHDVWVGTALFAQKKISLGKDVVIHSGGVWVNTVFDRRGRGHGRGHGRGDLKIDEDVYVSEDSDLRADRVEIKRGVVVDCNITCNELRNDHGEINGEVIEELETPIISEEDMLPFPEIEYNDEDIRVDRRETVELDEGAYGKIEVRRDATLVFTGGVYEIESLKIDRSSNVLFLDMSVVLIKGKIETRDDVYFGPEEDAEISARDILIYVEGARHLNHGHNNHREEAPGHAEKAKIGKENKWRANLYTPDGKIKIGDNTFAEGSFIGYEIKVGKETEIEFNGGFGKGKSVGKNSDSEDGFALREVRLIPSDIEVTAYPNPFNSSTTITFGLPVASHASLQLFDLSGRRVTIMTEGCKQPGIHTTTLNATNLPSGFYFVRLETSGEVFTQKIMLVR